ncbi:MAG: hypothetical protein COB41_09175 [Proteobacteria bacterium]|nr:MAG: hypothetical protein COB41_09175 [Pseudomonadota bacterium]
MFCNKNQGTTDNLLTPEEYKSKFQIDENTLCIKDIGVDKTVELIKNGDIKLHLKPSTKTVSEKALEHALDIRKFEIDLYWKRATYFWTFLGATLAGFLAVQASADLEPIIKQDLSVIIACLGIVFSFAWVCVNQGSKYWQANWEKHVDALEDEHIGPLYKTIMPSNKSLLPPMSVSKVNLLVSWYIFILWVLLLIYSLLPTFSLDNDVNEEYVTIIFVTITFCVSFLLCGRSSSANRSETHAQLRRPWSLKKGDKND